MTLYPPKSTQMSSFLLSTIFVTFHSNLYLPTHRIISIMIQILDISNIQLQLRWTQQWVPCTRTLWLRLRGCCQSFTHLMSAACFGALTGDPPVISLKYKTHTWWRQCEIALKVSEFYTRFGVYYTQNCIDLLDVLDQPTFLYKSWGLFHKCENDQL